MFRMIFCLASLFFLDILTSCFEGNPRFIMAITIVNTFTFVFEDLLGYTYWTYIRAELDLKGKFANITNKIAKPIKAISIRHTSFALMDMCINML